MKSKSGGKFVIGLIIAYLLLPLVLTLIYSLFTEWMDIFPSGFTLRYYAEIFADPDILGLACAHRRNFVHSGVRHGGGSAASDVRGGALPARAR